MLISESGPPGAFALRFRLLLSLAGTLVKAGSGSQTSFGCAISLQCCGHLAPWLRPPLHGLRTLTSRGLLYLLSGCIMRGCFGCLLSAKTGITCCSCQTGA